MKRTRYRSIAGLFILFIALILAPTVFAASPSMFTRYNIHVQERFKRSGEPVYKASYANYTNPGEGHLIVPAGSKISILKKSRKSFQFQVEGEKKIVLFEYHEPRMKMSVDAYIALITSSQPVSFKKLSKIDNKGRSEGKAFVGMSREGVKTALGYPAAHRTPELDASTWIYWADKFRTIAVHFNKMGRVDAIK